MNAKQPVDLATRLALRQSELADALGVSERTVRSIASQIPRVYVGTIPVYPVEAVKAWLEAQVMGEQRASDAVAEEILSALRE